MIMSTMLADAQITLENNYPASATLTELAVSGYKYYLMDVINNECKIYNTDHSVWKTILLDVPDGMYLYDVRYVSETLFNTDSKVELAYICYSYDTALYYYTYYGRIIDETGTELLTMPGCAYLEVKNSGSGGVKMLSYVYDYSILNWTVNTLVYSLPGTLPSDISIPVGGLPARKPFPNPARESVTIPYTLPDGVDEAEIQLFDGTGQMLRNYRVDRTFNQLFLAKSGLSNGIYFYRVCVSKGMVTTGKIIFE